MEDFLVNNNGQKIKLDEPNGIELPTKGFDCEDNGYQPSSKDGSNIHVIVKKDSKRLQLLTPFPSWDGENILGAKLLIKTKNINRLDLSDLSNGLYNLSIIHENKKEHDYHA